MTPRIELHIERLCVHGLDGVDAPGLETALVQALASELGTLWEIPATDVARVRGQITLPDQSRLSAQALAGPLARCLAGAIAGAGPSRAGTAPGDAARRRTP